MLLGRERAIFSEVKEMLTSRRWTLITFGLLTSAVVILLGWWDFKTKGQFSGRDLRTLSIVLTGIIAWCLLLWTWADEMSLPSKRAKVRASALVVFLLSCVAALTWAWRSEEALADDIKDGYSRQLADDSAKFHVAEQSWVLSMADHLVDQTRLRLNELATREGEDGIAKFRFDALPGSWLPALPAGDEAVLRWLGRLPRPQEILAALGNPPCGSSNFDPQRDPQKQPDTGLWRELRFAPLLVADELGDLNSMELVVQRDGQFRFVSALEGPAAVAYIGVISSIHCDLHYQLDWVKVFLRKAGSGWSPERTKLQRFDLGEQPLTK